MKCVPNNSRPIAQDLSEQNEYRYLIFFFIQLEDAYLNFEDETIMNLNYRDIIPTVLFMNFTE